VVSDEQYSRKLAEERREKSIIDDGEQYGAMNLRLERI
jgi:hypothetical protein|tara:strand:- start:4191 stop:4304 length:114 start_codon:yes stop_codon:yes gene_type:complete